MWEARFNADHGITPKTIQKRITSLHDSIWEKDYKTVPTRKELARDAVPPHELPALIDGLRQEMKEAADALDFERAVVLRDRVRDLEEERLRLS